MNAGGSSIFLCGRSALAIWQLFRCIWRPRLDQLEPLPHALRQLGIEPYCGGELSSCACSFGEARARAEEQVARLCARLPLDSREKGSLMHVPLEGYTFEAQARELFERVPVELLVPEASQRKKPHIEQYHVFGGAVTPDMFVCLGDDVYLMTPLHVLFQLAPQLDEIDLTMLAFELRGAYATKRYGLWRSKRCLPLFDQRDIDCAAVVAVGMSGTRRARRPLRISMDHAASVMEAASILLLCAPRKMGGYGFKRPVLNWRIDLPADMRGLSRWGWVACDAYWPQVNVAFEYDGKDHDEEEVEQRDRRRSNVIALLDIPVVSIADKEFYNVDEFDRAVRQLSELTGFRMNNRDYGPGWRRSRALLRKSVTGILKRKGSLFD